MSHNTPIENARFRVTFTETNLRYALGASPPDQELIAKIKGQLEEANALVQSLEAKQSE